MVSLSIIIPTYNRVAQLQNVLRALEAQDYPTEEFEVLVVSDGAIDGTEAFLRTYQPNYVLRPIFQPNQGVAAARNNGVQQARGEIVIFIDDDVVPSQQLVRQHAETHAAEGQNVVVLGPMLTPDDHTMQPWVRWEQAMLYKQYDAMVGGKHPPTARQFFTGNTSLARCHLLNAGGFDHRFRRAEDVELAYRLADMGIRFVFNPQAHGYHYAERSYATWMAIPYTYGKYDVIFTREKQQPWLLPMIWNEYYSRHPLTRALTHLCLDRKPLSTAVMVVLKSGMMLFHRAGLRRGTTFACSSLFNLRYYQGISDQLGGRKAFFTGARAMKGKLPEQLPTWLS